MIGMCRICGKVMDGFELMPMDTGDMVCVDCYLRAMMDFDSQKEITGKVDW